MKMNYLLFHLMKDPCIFVKIQESYTQTPSGGGVHTLINDCINDDEISNTSTWSSDKIDSKINDKGNELTKDYNNKIKIASPINILDNSDFRNPVNQRSVTDWNYIGYGIDRWFTNGVSANISVTGNGLQGSANFLVQRFEKIKLNDTSKVTAAVQVNGAIYSGVINISNLTAGSDIIVITGIPGLSRVTLYYENNDICQFYFADLDNVKIEWAALYIGEYSTETLPEYHPKEYSTELAECQRYYRDIYLRGAVGFILDADKATFNLGFVKMRLAVPTVQVIVGDNLVTKEGYFPVLSEGAYFEGNNNVVLKVSNSLNLSNFYPVGAFFVHIALSADL